MPEASSFEILTDGMMGYIVSKQRVQVANLNPQGDHAPERVYRHLNTCQMETYIYVRPPRVNCPVHGTFFCFWFFGFFGFWGRFFWGRGFWGRWFSKCISHNSADSSTLAMARLTLDVFTPK